jgi:hypothetical protein
MLELDVLKALLEYDPLTGSFIWLQQVSNRIKVGSLAGNFDKDGYRTIQLCGTKYRAGRLAYFYMTGRWPVHEIDHIDGDRTNESWSNLREVTRCENIANSDRQVGTSGLRGVKWDPNASVWRARIAYRGRREYVGAYATKEEAYKAYLEAADAIHGEFALHNRPNQLGAA